MIGDSIALTTYPAHTKYPAVIPRSSTRNSGSSARYPAASPRVGYGENTTHSSLATNTQNTGASAPSRTITGTQSTAGK